MKKVNWQSMDKPEIVALILKQNDFATPELRRRVKNKLDAMDAVTLWNHIKKVYNNDLYDEDIVIVDQRERKARERELEKERLKRRTVVKTVHIPTITIQPKYSITDDAENTIWGLSCVKKVFRYGDKLAIIMEDTSKRAKLERYIKKHYPKLNWEVLA
jgi:hypothetical protein